MVVWSGGGCGAGSLFTLLATQFAALALGQTAPNAELLAVREREVETVLLHDAATADFLGFTGGRSTLWEEQIRVDTQTVGLVLPLTVADERQHPTFHDRDSSCVPRAHQALLAVGGTPGAATLM
jgi:hypothetical protein